MTPSSQTPPSRPLEWKEVPWDDLATKRPVEKLDDGTAHLWTQEMVWALEAALATGRPLLVRGEPGVGKSQLARAAASLLGWPLVTKVVDARTEASELLYEFDLVRRLADAQAHKGIREDSDYLVPGVLWWAFAWEDAKGLPLARGAEPRKPEGWAAGRHGVVVLLDEIDKAETEVPAALLGALGDHRFHVRGRPEAVELRGQAPLVVATTNEERELPAPFVRRCLVLRLDFPDEETLRRRAYARLGQGEKPPDPWPELVGRAIEDLFAAREERSEGEPRPGQAELFDLLDVLRYKVDAKSGEDLSKFLERYGVFTLRKHEDAFRNRR